MPSNLRANIELGINIVIAVAVVVVAGVVVKRYAFPQPVSSNGGQQQQQRALTVGSRINIPDIDLAQNKKTLVFFLKKDCVFCKASAPIYRELIADAAKKNVKWLAILPNPVEEGKEYVHSLDLPIEIVQSGSLAAYKIPGTPTVLLADGSGTVRSIWIGDVSGRENDIRAELAALFEATFVNETAKNKAAEGVQPDAASGPAAPDLEAAELKKLVEARTPITIIDLDERTDFKKGHIPNARNIPVDEMSSRVPREIPKETRVILYCRCKGGSAAVDAKAGLKEMGYTQVSVLKGGLDSWQSLGMKITAAEKQ